MWLMELLWGVLLLEMAESLKWKTQNFHPPKGKHKINYTIISSDPVLQSELHWRLEYSQSSPFLHTDGHVQLQLSHTFN